MPGNLEIVVGNVGVFGIGATNSREAINLVDGLVTETNIISTPSNRDDFFRWMARRTLDFESVNGCPDVFAGFPGPVEHVGDRTILGPMVNIDWLKGKGNTVVLEEELRRVNKGLGRKIDNGDIRIMATNDGTLHAGAAHHFRGDGEQRISGLIVGTGVGGDTIQAVDGVTYRRAGDDTTHQLYQPLPGRREWGHIYLSPNNTADTYETRYQGGALKSQFGISPEDAPADHDMWVYAGQGIADLIGIVALNDTPELIVLSGGVGAGAFNKLMPHIYSRLNEMRLGRNVMLGEALDVLERITSVDNDKVDTSELYGAPVLMAAHQYSMAS